MVLLVILVAIPAGVFAQNALKNQQRKSRYKAMSEIVQQMHELTMAIYQYTFEANGKMPPMQNITVLQKALKPYSRPSIFVSSASGKPFKLNSKLSGKPLDKSNRIVWCYDTAMPGPYSPDIKRESYRVVGFSNSVIAMPEARWQREKKTSGLP